MLNFRLITALEREPVLYIDNSHLFTMQIDENGNMSLELDAVLSAPNSANQIYTLNAVICVVSVLSAIGAGWIVASFLVGLLFMIMSITANPS
jgi:hypothetical protein